MASSLYSGVSGLTASSKQLDVIGNNIANLNTTGFKAGKISFSDILEKNMTGLSSSQMQIGRGVTVNAVDTQFSLGSFETTANASDLAISGNGFFIVEDGQGIKYYTRAGSFRKDTDGYLIDLNGYRLQGYQYPDDNTVTDICLNNIQSEPKASTNFTVGVNLNSATEAGDVFKVSQGIYDSLGAEHTLKLTFTKTATAGTWDITANLDDYATAATLPAGTQVTFDGDGKLTAPAGDVAVDFSALTLPEGATIGAGNIITWGLSDSAEAITGYSDVSIVKSFGHDGYASGFLQDITVDDSGVINGFFTNGQSSDIGQILLADFSNPNGLKKVGSNLFRETNVSGDPMLKTPGEGGVGEIFSYTLEMSNTDMATEFVNMITAQKAYQANAKVVTTTDTMLSELMNMKR